MTNEEVKERSVTYHPLGSAQEITLTIGMTRRFLVTPSKSGAMPGDADIVRFLMLCQARRLDPWVGDAYLVGYDTQGPAGIVAQWSLITAVQAIYKRAEASPDFNGIESGVILAATERLEYRPGDLVLPDERLVGGWARAYRKQIERPFFDALKLEVYHKRNKFWERDPAGMIVKCAEASVLRKAFPSSVGGLYLDAEMDSAAAARHALDSEDVESRTIEQRVESVKAARAALPPATHAPTFSQQMAKTKPELQPADKPAAVAAPAAVAEPVPGPAAAEPVRRGRGRPRREATEPAQPQKTLPMEPPPKPVTATAPQKELDLEVEGGPDEEPQRETVAAPGTAADDNGGSTAEYGVDPLEGIQEALMECQSAAQVDEVVGSWDSYCETQADKDRLSGFADERKAKIRDRFRARRP